MTKTVRVIGCVSSETRQHLIFRSMIRVLNQGSTANLKHQWSFSEVGPYDVTIFDLDDGIHPDPLPASGAEVVVAFSTHPHRLTDRPFSLSKPIRGSEFLQLLQAIEAACFDNLTHPATAVTATEAATPAPRPADAAMPDPAPLLSLLAWPDLPQLPDDQLHHAARICALLAVRRCSPATVSRFLDIDPVIVDQVLQAIAACPPVDGVEVLHRQQDAAEAANVIPLHEQTPSGKPSSFLSKIWNRLKGAA
ncbi:hypothetical protein EV700_2370 [Fluviicoccus keumensis]|uniref:Uncharacterized protein n=1 Tax=Fluviicoccus keumensis TaxID=1435465 RepID=A0A4Q7YM93_9GAMM|nr:hypothetical protein [Fluviicoccus keumensis]RZU38438.1 hypothetical protein EV700_2370 [Fluviicoccus keumensis]